MTLLTPSIASPVVTAAVSLAAQNFSANLAALSQTQPDLHAIMQSLTIDVTWTFGRDGFLTALNPDGSWWANCSLPLLAARSILKSLEMNNQVSCFLAPVQAGLLIAARERMGGDPALLAIVPDPTALRVILSCHDFASDIQSHHLWFVTGDDWSDQLQSLFKANPGLPTPARFIRTKLTTDDLIEPMIADAQKVFAAALSERAESVDSIRSRWTEPSARENILLIAGSRFRLWDDAGETLRTALDDQSNILVFNSDDPACASPLALATAAQSCRDILAANISRCDAPNLTRPDARWITWLTRPQIPDASTAGERDVLILADISWKSLALSAGWPAHRLRVAGWPVQYPAGTKPPKPLLAVLADTRPIELPRAIEDLSSHRILWDFIGAELTHTPLVIDRLEAYLDDRCRRYSIKPETIDRRAFIESLIVPAFQQGLVRLILRASIPIQLYGAGWQDLDEFRPHSAGPVTSRPSLLAAVESATALLYPWPVRHAHPIDAMSKPVITPLGHRTEPFRRQIQAALQNTTPPAKPSRENLSSEIRSLLNSNRSSSR